MNPDLERLQPYPFSRLQQLIAGITPVDNVDKPYLPLSIGEPKMPTPQIIREALADQVDLLNCYPATKGELALRQAIATWLIQRFQLTPESIDPESQVLPVNGTREALFAIAQAVVNPGQGQHIPTVVFANPFYQIYEGAAILAGAKPVSIACHATQGFMPDFSAVSESIWQRCQLVYVCSPNNPTGAVYSQDTLRQLLDLSARYGFVIASDECYSELYYDEANPPPGLLQVAHESGRDFKNLLVFHSLSKRSSAPGLRSGFVAGDADLLKQFLLYRTYHGSAMPVHHQRASAVAWQDEAHVQEIRQGYRQRFQAFLAEFPATLGLDFPAGGVLYMVKDTSQ
jgi:N-succinyldiaminopimelate aminotransferase